MKLYSAKRASSPRRTLMLIAEKQAKRFVPLLEQAVQQTACIAGEQFSVADITALCALEFSRVIQLDWSNYPALQRWYQRMQQRPSYGVEF